MQRRRIARFEANRLQIEPRIRNLINELSTYPSTIKRKGKELVWETCPNCGNETLKAKILTHNGMRYWLGFCGCGYRAVAPRRHWDKMYDGRVRVLNDVLFDGLNLSNDELHDRLNRVLDVGLNWFGKAE